MKDFLKDKYKEILVILILVLFLVTVSAKHRLDRELSWYDKFVIETTAPIQYLFNFSISSVLNFFNRYIYLINVKADNEFLIRSNKALKNEIDKLAEIKIENGRLRNLLQFKEQLGVKMLPAEVISVDVSDLFETIRINKGRRQGVGIQMPVVNHEGVIGQVLRVSDDYSDILLITDPNSSVDALIQRSRIRGVAKGASSQICKLKYLNRIDDVKVGDRIVTSGLASRFPKGINIGEVTRVEKKKYGITQDVKITPSVNFNKLEEVFLIVERK